MLSRDRIGRRRIADRGAAAAFSGDFAIASGSFGITNNLKFLLASRRKEGWATYGSPIMGNKRCFCG